MATMPHYVDSLDQIIISVDSFLHASIRDYAGGWMTALQMFLFPKPGLSAGNGYRLI